MSKILPYQILIIKTGSALKSLVSNPKLGDFSDMLKRVIPLSVSELFQQEFQLTQMFSFTVIDVTQHPEKLPTNPKEYTAIIIHGSPHMVTDRLPWSEATAQWIKNLVVPSGVPLLGICYGHQLICHALGGKVDYNPNGKELGTVEVKFGAKCKNDHLFSDLCGKKVFLPVTHSQSIIEGPKLKDFYILASSDCEGFEAVHFTGNCWGFQFHPEFNREYIKTFEIEEAVEFRRGKKKASNYVMDSYKRINEEFNRSLVKRFVLFSIEQKDYEKGISQNLEKIKLVL